MPLVGVVDPSHESKAKNTAGKLPPWLTLDEALAAGEDLKWAPYTPTLMNAIFSEFQERDYISTSMLVAHCPRAEVLKRRFPYVDDLDSLYIPWKGTMVHRTMELYSHAEAIAEFRFWVTVKTEAGDVLVSCSPDLLTRRTLTDYKYTDSPPMYNYMYTHHKEQLMVNAYIARNAERVAFNGADVEWESLPFDPRENPVEQVAIVYLGPKWPKVLVAEHTEQVFDSKTGKFKKAKVSEVWSDKKVEAFIRPRIETYQEALHAPYVSHNTDQDTTLEPHLWTSLKGIDLAWPVGAEDVWGGEPNWRCPGAPLCMLPNCLAKRWPNRLIWRKP